MKEKDILFESGDYWICKEKVIFKVFKNGVTHATLCATIGYDGEKGLNRAKDEITRRIELDKKKV